MSTALLFHVGDLEIDVAHHRVTRNGEVVEIDHEGPEAFGARRFFHRMLCEAPELNAAFVATATACLVAFERTCGGFEPNPTWLRIAEGYAVAALKLRPECPAAGAVLMLARRQPDNTH